jgi:hypothetical protein
MRRLLARRWSADDDADLIALWMRGRPAIHIARKLRRGLSSIYTRAKVLGLPTRPSLPSPPIIPNHPLMPGGTTRL